MEKRKQKNSVFYISLILIAIMAVWSVAFNESFTKVSDAAFAFLTTDFGWLYLLAMIVFLVFVLYVAFGQYGKIRLGGDDSRPEYSNLTWFGLLFGCGMGVGLVFWGVAEPLTHYLNPVGVESATPEAAVFATVAGIVTSLGLGTMQINAGFNKLFGIPTTLLVQIGIVVVVSILYIGSAVSGIEKGIKVISDTNLYVAIGLLLVCFLVGPKIEILDSFVNGIGQYIGDFIPDALKVGAYGDNSWLGSWRLFYWAWFIAWAPFVGVFIARISKGRTIREFVLGVVLVPAFASCIWGAVFGSLGINLGETGVLSLDVLNEVAATPEVGLFVVLQKYPLGFVLCIVALVSLCAFFITSANSGVYVLSMLTTDGEINPPNSKKILWGMIQSVMAVGLLMAGGLKPLQTISLAAAFPFILIMFAACAAFIKAIKKEKI